MRTVILFYCLLFIGFIANPTISSAQVTSPPPGDSIVNVEILPGVRKLEFRKLNDSTQLQILAGNVKLKQGTSLFYCDSCVINNNTNTFEAWGNVHVNDADTAHIYSSHLRYLTDKRIAYLDGGVRMTDGKGTLTTPNLEYDMSTDIGTYLNNGRVLNKKTVLTSKEGYYYAGLKDVYFKKDVELKDPAYYIKTDSLLYNTESQTARFIAKTFIRDSSGRTIETSEGYYNLATGKAEFGGRPIIKDKALTITANDIVYDDSSKITHARGNVVIVDTVNKTTIIAGEVFHDNNRDRMLATRKPLMIIKQEDDSIYVTADTLFSARLTDLNASRDSLKNIKDSLGTKDTLQGTQVVDVNKKDSTNRYFEAFRNVRVFSDSLQAISDSLFYSFKDSTFQLFQDPVVWAKASQVTGDTIYLYTKNKKADKLEVFDNSFMVNEVDPGIYNQVKSSRMDAFFINGDLDSVRANGQAETIYYIQDEDSAYTGINEARSDIMDIYFKDKELFKVVYRSSVTGTVWPMRQKDPAEMRLPNFRWLEERRPKTKYELFE
jgi:lipopolysaccharide assembly outer membrane protein LptD (OstA)